MGAAEAKVITDAALLWERMSLKRGITPAGLTRFSEEARLLRDVLIAAGANVGDDTAGLTNFLRRIRSFLKRDGGWLAAQNPDITDFLRACGAVTIDGTTVRILLPRLFSDKDSFAGFEAAVSELRQKRALERAARRATLQAKNKAVNALQAPAVDAAFDARCMAEALAEARAAADRGEVPVGAVLVHEGSIIARAGNRVREMKDATAHAEVLVLRQAGRMLGSERLTGAVLYVTLEPCPMCAAAAALARVKRIVWGADDAKCGALKSTTNVIEACRMNHRPLCTCGVEKEAAVKLLQDFFAGRRKEKAR